MEKEYDYIIAGSGLFGATCARLATDAGAKCLVLEKRTHTGGNIYCENIEGINVHKYGAHIFHTSNKRVWDFVNSFIPFNRYTNCPVALYKGRLFNLPFNMNTFHQLWGCVTPADAEERIAIQTREAAEDLRKQGVEEPRNLEEQALTLIGRDIYEYLIKDYTEKQWGRPCRELPAFIIRRLPVRLTYDNNYFNDAFQGIPIGGYNRLTDRLLNGIQVVTATDFNKDRERWKSMAQTIVYTGPIDEYFDFRLGELQYRTVRFDTEILNTPNFQGNAVVNYTDSEHPYTRIIEHKHFEAFGNAVYDNPKTVVSREYSQEWNPGMEPFYPINDNRNSVLLERYKQLAAEEKNVIFGGRLAEYKYYDMDKVIEQAMNCFENLHITHK